MENVYLLCAAIGGTLLVAQFVMSLIGIGGDDLNAGHDADPEVDAGEGWFVGMLSLRALTGAITFFGLGGLAARSAEFEPTPTVIVAVVAALASMYLIALTLRWMRHLQAEGNARITSAVGQPGTVYVPIPQANSGQGKVTVTLQNRSLEYAAMTPHNEQLPTGATVIVTAVVNPETLEVMPEGHPQPESANA